ncbi:hypothetical protein ACFWHR_07490 [Leucobacter sp. NPDC058333]|uniref:hypothetical protein n=1 Tax=Leucobacter sp. NPDC058333 TaxID=3346450 RepID=UPI0036493EC3
MLLAARNLTTEELCRFAGEYEELGEHSLAQLYADALSVHAYEVGWGEIIRQSIHGWKEVEEVENPLDQARVLEITGHLMPASRRSLTSGRDLLVR